MTRPEFDPTSPVAQAWTGGMSLDSLSEGIRLNQVGSTQQSVDTQRFWSTPPRAAEDTTREVMQLTFAAPRRLNRLEFDLAVFPQDLTIEYYDEQTGAWAPCLDDFPGDPQPVSYSNRESIPTVLPPASAVLGHLHPQHSFTGHWRTVSFTIRPVYTKDLRIVLARTTEGATPTNAQGAPTPYSLAVRNLNMTYTITKLADVPWTTPTATGEERDTFASTSDLFGSVVDFSVRVNAATNAIGTTTGANGLTTVWKSEPQPIPWAVVNFYVDGRDGQGGGQLLDRFFVDPLYDGPTCNLYWSNSEPSGRFRANSDPVPPVIAAVNNSGGVTGNVLDFDDPALIDAIAFVEIDGRGISFNPSRPWWLGGRLNFKFRHGTQSDNQPIFDCGEFTLSWTPVGPVLSTGYGDSIALRTETPPLGVGEPLGGEPPQLGDPDPVFLPFDPIVPLNFVAWSDTRQIGLTISYGNNRFTGTLPLSVPLASHITKARVGGFLGATPGSPKSRMSALVLKVDTSPTAEEIDDFLADPFPYVLGSQYLGVNDPRTDNALLRYHPSFYSLDFPAAFIGGAPDRYADMDWSPVARDFVLRRGYLHFPPTRAKFWKLEFTNLSPQAYEVYKPVQKSVNIFPSELWLKSLPPGTPMSQSAQDELAPGLNNIYVVNTLTQTLDNGQTAIVGTGAAKSNTSARVIYDDTTRSQVSSAYWAWSFLPLHHCGATPVWESTGQHHYQVIDFVQSTKIGYFVGLRKIEAFRVDYISTDDTPQYEEMFFDTGNIEPSGNWLLPEDHYFTSGGASYAEARSKPMASNRLISALQFATQQSDPVQLLPDSELTEPELNAWDPVGDATLSDSSGLNPTLRATKRIDRSLPPLTWGRVMAGYPTWGDFLSTSATYGVVASGSQIPAETGGMTSKPLTVPSGGRIHAAARVAAPQALSRPLYVQIVDAATESVLSEEAVEVPAGKITEWYTSYTIGEGIDGEPWLYRDFFKGYSSTPQTDTFARADAATLGTMGTGQVWRWPLDGTGAEYSLDIATNAATVTDQGQYDYIDTGNPWGTLEVTVGAMGTTVNGLVALLRLDPLFLTETGLLGVLSGSSLPSTRGYVLTTSNAPYAVQSGDVIRVDFLPAEYVPSGKADPTASALDQYAVMFWVNGVWKATRTHNYGALGTRGLKGRLGQKFTKWSWVPASYGVLPGTTLQDLPRLGSGDWVDPSSKLLWRTPTGQEWRAEGSWDVSNEAERFGVANTDIAATFSTDKLAVGSSQLVGVVARHDGVSLTYFARVVINTSGTMQLQILYINGGTENTLVTNTVAGLTHTANTAYRIRFQVIGTTLQAKLWLASTAEPGAWTVTTTDSNLASGFYGTYNRLSSTVTNAPVTVTWDNFVALHPGTASTAFSEQFGYTASNGWGKGWRTLGGTVADFAVTSGEGTVVVTSVGPPARVTFTGILRDDTGATLTAASDNAVFWTDTEAWYGAMSLRLRRIAGTAGQVDPAGRRGLVACLDYDAKIFLAANGDIVQGNSVSAGYTTLQSGFISGGLPLDKDITLVFVNARHTNPAATSQKQLYAQINQVTAGTANSGVVGQLLGTKRGLAGSLFSGTRPAGPNWTIDTAFQSFTWAPLARVLAQTATAPTWGSVTKNGTLTYGEIMAVKDITVTDIKVRVVQRGPSEDIWDVDNVSLFADPIVWSFSHDGGFTFYPAYEIRNNPSGVMVFPETSAAVSLDQKPGTALVWKVVSYRPGSIVSSLVIRPWYGGLMSGISHRVGLVATSPNVSPYDQFGDIRKDARFQTWSKPVPRQWWYEFQVIQKATQT